LKYAGYILIALFFLVVPSLSFADGSDPLDMSAMQDMSGRKISSVTIIPDIGIAKPAKFLGITDETVISQELVGAVIEKIWSTGRVAKVSVFAKPRGTHRARLVIRVTLRMHLHDIEFDGNKHVKAGELKEVAGFRPDMEVFDDTIQKVEAQILERYAMRGYPYASAAIETLPMKEQDKVKLKVKIDEGKAVRMWKISYTGRPIFSLLKLKKLTGLKDTDVYDQVKIEAGIEKIKKQLRKIGFYNCKVDPPVMTLDEQSRLIVEIRIDPGPHFKVLFIGNDHVSSEKILEVLEFDKQPEVNPAVLEELAEGLMEYYRKLGFTMATVATGMTTEEEGKKGVILFTIQEGKRLFVKDILFAGNKHFSSKFLRKEVEGVLNGAIDYKLLFVEPSFESLGDIGLAGAMPEPSKPAGKRTIALAPWKPKHIYLKEAYDDAAKHIGELYAVDGYLEAEVMEPAIQIDDKGQQVTVTFVIDEGRRTWIKSVSFEGTGKKREMDLRKLVGISPGKPFNGLAVKEAENSILEYYFNRGYRFAAVASDVKFSDDGSEAYLTYKVEEGPLVYVDGIDVRGNLATQRSLILDRITLKPGTLFTLKEQNKSSGYLRDLGIFNSVVISLQEPSIVGSKKRALVQLIEKKSQYLELRAGASSGEGLRGGLEYGYRNLFGYALDFGFIASFNYRFFFVGTGQYFPEWYRDDLSLLQQLERNIAVRFGVPHLPKVGRWLTIETSFGHLRKNANLYGLTKNSVYASLLFGPVTAVHFAIRAGFEDSDLGTNTVAERALSSQIQNLSVCTQQITRNCLTPAESRTLRLPVGKTAFWVVGTDFTLDLRDSAFNPTSGLRLSMGVSWVRSTDHAAQVHRYYADNEAYKTWTTYAFSNLLRNTLSISGYIPLGTKRVILLLYGAAGYIFQLQDGSETFADRLFYLGGGHTMRGFPEESLCAVESPPGICLNGGSLMVNYKIELLFPIYKELGGAVFSDLGNLWKDPSDFSIIDLRATVGLGIRYSTPIGPLNFDYGIIVNRDESRGDPFGAVHFSIGTF
jgi:outer membrane protein insertion porin family